MSLPVLKPTCTAHQDLEKPLIRMSNSMARDVCGKKRRLSPNSSRNRTKHTDNEWNEQKTKIWALYITHNLDLSTVMKQMQEEQGFRASQGTYKRWFEKWGWRKNGEYSCLRLDKDIKLPDVYGKPSVIIRSLNDYAKGSFDSDWEMDKLGEYRRISGHDNKRSFEELKRTLHLALEIAKFPEHDSFSGIRGSLGWVLAHAFELLPNLFYEQHPLTIIQLFAILRQLPESLNAFATLFVLNLRFWPLQLGLPKLHPLRVIFYELWGLYLDNMGNSTTTKLCLKEFTRSIVKDYTQVAGHKLCSHGVLAFLISYLQQTNDYEPEMRRNVENSLPSLISTYTEISDMQVDRMHLWFHMSYWHLNLAELGRNIPACIQISRDMLDRSKKHLCAEKPCLLVERCRYTAWETLAEHSLEICHTSQAEEYLEQAIESRIEHDRHRQWPLSPNASRKLLSLLLWYRRHAKHERVSLAYNRVLQRLRLYERNDIDIVECAQRLEDLLYGNFGMYNAAQAIMRVNQRLYIQRK